MQDVVKIAGCVVNYVPVVLFTVGRSDGGGNGNYSVAVLHNIKYLWE